MEMNPGELVDKLTISKLYTERERIGIKEYARLNAGMGNLKKKYPKLPWDALIDAMYSVNSIIWDYEAPIHTGKMDGDPVIAGILSLRVRKFNDIRVKLSKLIDQLANGGDE